MVRRDGILPVAVKIVTRDVDRLHLSFSDLEAYAAIDRTAGQPSRLGGRRDTTIVPPQRFVGSEQTPATLIKMHRYVLPAHPDIVDVDHPPRIAFRARVAPSAFAILFLRSSLALDSLVSRRAL